MNYLELKIPPPIFAVSILVLMYFSKDLFPHLDISHQFSGAIAVLLFLLGISIGIVSVFQFKQAKTTINPASPQDAQTIVCTGLFALTRNPMYLGLVICITAAGIALQHLGGVGFLVFSVIYLQRFQIIPEERILAEKFGETYTDYCERVARWM